jgi:hypothetical protein
MSKHALQIEAGAKAAELHATLKHRDELKAKVSALEKKVKTANANLKASYARIGFAMSDNPSPEELEAGKAYLDGYRTRQKQLADAQFAALGFMPKGEMDAAMQAVFQK